MNPRVEIQRQRLGGQARPVSKVSAIAKLGDYDNVTGLTQAIQPNGGITYGTNLSNVAQQGDLMRVVQARGGLTALDNLSISSAQIITGVASNSNPNSIQNEVFASDDFSAYNGDIFSKDQPKKKQKSYGEGTAEEVDGITKILLYTDPGQGVFGSTAGSFTFTKPIKGDFMLTFEYQVLERASGTTDFEERADGLAVSLTKTFGLDITNTVSTLGVKASPVDILDGEFAVGIDQFDNNLSQGAFNRNNVPRVFILTSTQGRSFVFGGFLKTWIDDPIVASPKATELVDIIGSTVFKPASISLIEGIIKVDFNGVIVESPMIGDPSGNYLKITASTSRDVGSNYYIKDVLLQRA